MQRIALCVLALAAVVLVSGCKDKNKGMAMGPAQSSSLAYEEPATDYYGPGSLNPPARTTPAGNEYTEYEVYTPTDARASSSYSGGYSGSYSSGNTVAVSPPAQQVFAARPCTSRLQRDADRWPAARGHQGRDVVFAGPQLLCRGHVQVADDLRRQSWDIAKSQYAPRRPGTGHPVGASLRDRVALKSRKRGRGIADQARVEVVEKDRTERSCGKACGMVVRQSARASSLRSVPRLKTWGTRAGGR
jgi:hypothetical protein